MFVSGMTVLAAVLTISLIFAFRVRRLRKWCTSIREEGENLFSALFKDNHQVILIIDPDTGDIVEANRAAARFYGYSEDEIKKLKIKQINTMGQEEIRRKMSEAMDRGKVSFNFRHKLRDGSIRDVQVFTGPIIFKGKKLLYSAINDISDKVRADMELIRALDRAESANRAKSEFLANMSHEVRTPLNGAMGMLQLLRVTDIDAEQSEYVESAYRACNNLLRLLSDLLDLSKIEAGKVELVREEFCLSDIVRDVESNFSVLSKSKGIDLILRIEEDVPNYLRGDPLRIRQILFNLVGNAVKFTESGYVMVEISTLSPVHEKSCRLLLSVHDTGVGIPEGMTDKVFEAFTQAENSYSRKIEGVGLGLQIVKRLVNLMGGNLALESEEEVGTSFMISFEVGISEKTSDKEIQKPLERDISESGASVLLVEDDPVNMKVVATMLRKGGVSVETASNGRQAVEILSRKNFDLVLMDVQMPEMDGVSATRIIRTSPKFESVAGVPIIALTAYVMTGDREKFVNAGMDDYISKPVDYDVLMDKVSRYCCRH